MKELLKAAIYLAGSVSLFALLQLIVVFSPEISLRNIVLSLFPIAFTFLLYLIYLKESKKPYEEECEIQEYEEGEVINIFGGMPWSNKNGKYSEGVFFWYENGKLLTTLDFHIDQGGDPDVFNQWLEQEKESPQYLQPTLQ